MVVGFVISVTAWFPEAVPPGTNSETVPVTVTASPTATPFGVEPVKTKTPFVPSTFRISNDTRDAPVAS